jgi:tRNA-uridine 2-sulfurtransferase
MKNNKKVVVAVSGGVDSAVAALLYQQKGYEVIGVTMYLHKCGGSGEGGSNVDDAAKEVCDKLGIEHLVLNAEDKFTKIVLNPSWEEYNAGRTPNPCAICNRHIKFGALLDYALELGAEGLVTGHHTQILRTSQFTTIKKGSDPNKDQSYFLFALTQEQLAKIHMPIGEITKQDVRNIAEEAGLPNHRKKESQDACFGYDDEAFSETLRKMFKGTPKPGRFISPDGKELGQHKGVHQFTIGQRRGLGIALGAPAYVVNLNAETGDVIISTDESLLFSDTFEVKDLNWQITPELLAEKRSTQFKDSFDCGIRVRYRSGILPGTVTIKDKNTVIAKFAEPQRAITPGQAAVFYEEDLLIGGGWIC